MSNSNRWRGGEAARGIEGKVLGACRPRGPLAGSCEPAGPQTKKKCPLFGEDEMREPCGNALHAEPRRLGLWLMLPNGLLRHLAGRHGLIIGGEKHNPIWPVNFDFVLEFVLSGHL